MLPPSSVCTCAARICSSSSACQFWTSPGFSVSRSILPVFKSIPCMSNSLDRACSFAPESHLEISTHRRRYPHELSQTGQVLGLLGNDVSLVEPPVFISPTPGRKDVLVVELPQEVRIPRCFLVTARSSLFPKYGSIRSVRHSLAPGIPSAFRREKFVGWHVPDFRTIPPRNVSVFPAQPASRPA